MSGRVLFSWLTFILYCVILGIGIKAGYDVGRMRQPTLAPVVSKVGEYDIKLVSDDGPANWFGPIFIRPDFPTTAAPGALDFIVPEAIVYNNGAYCGPVRTGNVFRYQWSLFSEPEDVAQVQYYEEHEYGCYRSTGSARPVHDERPLARGDAVNFPKFFVWFAGCWWHALTV